MHLLIDDVRDLPGMDIICRTAVAGIKAVKQLSPTHLYIDHDLGTDSINGYQVIMQLLEAKKCPIHVQVVSSNPVGVKNISAALIDAGFLVALDGRNFKKEKELK